MSEFNIDNFHSALNELGQDEKEPFAALETLLAMDEASFAVMAPQVQHSFELSFNNITDKLVLVQAINAVGGTAEDFNEAVQSLVEAIEAESSLSVQKRDFLKTLLMNMSNAFADTEGIAKRYINVPIELCHPDAIMPDYAHLTDSGMDLYAVEDTTIGPGEIVLVPTGIKLAIPAGYEVQIRPKSGRALKTRLRIANTPGTIDAGYRDEIKVIVENVDPPIKKIYTDENGMLTGCDFGSSYTIGKGEKFCQMVLQEVPKMVLNQVDSVLDIGEDRGGGFGSTTLTKQDA